METNRQRCERLGMMDEETLMDISQDKRCELCNRLIEKNLSPQNPACEGKWCETAIDLWLDSEAEVDERECANCGRFNSQTLSCGTFTNDCMRDGDAYFHWIERKE